MIRKIRRSAVVGQEEKPFPNARTQPGDGTMNPMVALGSKERVGNLRIRSMPVLRG